MDDGLEEMELHFWNTAIQDSSSTQEISTDPTRGVKGDTLHLLVNHIYFLLVTILALLLH